jgi:hypothetical protein
MKGVKGMKKEPSLVLLVNKKFLRSVHALQIFMPFSQYFSGSYDRGPGHT